MGVLKIVLAVLGTLQLLIAVLYADKGFQAQVSTVEKGLPCHADPVWSGVRFLHLLEPFPVPHQAGGVVGIWCCRYFGGGAAVRRRVPCRRAGISSKWSMWKASPRNRFPPKRRNQGGGGEGEG